MCAYLVIWEDRLKPAISRTVYGPLMTGTERTHPLGKLIRIRIDCEFTSPRLYLGYSLLSSVEGCKLPPLKNRSADSDSRRSCRVEFYYMTTSGTDYSSSEFVAEGWGSLQNTLQWDEALYM